MPINFCKIKQMLKYVMKNIPTYGVKYTDRPLHAGMVVNHRNELIDRDPVRG